MAAMAGNIPAHRRDFAAAPTPITAACVVETGLPRKVAANCALPAYDYQRKLRHVRMLARVLELNNFCNLILTPRTLIRALVITGLVRENADERHAAAASRTNRAHNNLWRPGNSHRHHFVSTQNKQDHNPLSAKLVGRQRAAI
jgi:hypothetical protein